MTGVCKLRNMVNNCQAGGTGGNTFLNIQGEDHDGRGVPAVLMYVEQHSPTVK